MFFRVSPPEPTPKQARKKIQVEKRIQKNQVQFKFWTALFVYIQKSRKKMERVKPYVTEEQIRAAKAVNTLAFLLRHQPERFKRVGRTEYAHYDHDSLKVGANGKWNWHSRA